MRSGSAPGSTSVEYALAIAPAVVAANFRAKSGHDESRGVHPGCVAATRANQLPLLVTFDDVVVLTPTSNDSTPLDSCSSVMRVRVPGLMPKARLVAEPAATMMAAAASEMILSCAPVSPSAVCCCVVAAAAAVLSMDAPDLSGPPLLELRVQRSECRAGRPRRRGVGRRGAPLAVDVGSAKALQQARLHIGAAGPGPRVRCIRVPRPDALRHTAHAIRLVIQPCA